MVFQILIGILIALVIGILTYKIFFSKPNDFWENLGIREIDTSPAVSKLDILLSRKTMTEADHYAYTKMSDSEKFCGTWQIGKPLLIIKDKNLMRKVMIKDLDFFVDRRQFFSKEADGCLKFILPALQGDEWKGVRHAVSPTFTTGKIRRMMEIFNKVGKEWVEEYTENAKSSSNGSVTVNFLEAVNHLTLEMISNAAFGMSGDVIRNPNSEFAKMAYRLSNLGKMAVVKLLLKIQFPKLCGFLRISPFDQKALKYFENILEKSLKSRMNGETVRNDFLQLLMEAKKGELKASGSDELNNFEKDAQISEELPEKQWLTQDVMNGQSMVFFFGGYSPTSNFLTFALYSLALNMNVQEKLREEVNKIFQEDGSFDYDDVSQLVYLDMVLCEVLRIFPSAERHERVCVKDYNDPESGLALKKGAIAVIPVKSLHNSKEHYENPEKFDPNHFAPDKKAARSPYAYMPFGMGPRNCLGMRFALIEGKSSVAHIVHNFIIEPTEKTPVPLQGIPAGFGLFPPKNLELRFIPIENKHSE